MSAKKGPAIPNVKGGGYKPQTTSNVLTYVLVSVGLIAVAALVIGGVVWNANRTKAPSASNIDLNGPVTQGVSDMTFGAPNAPVSIEIYEDPLCPACGMFEQTQGEAITAAINEQKLRVRFRTLNFLNDASASRDYSTRAGAALQCVAGEKNQDVFLKFHSALFAQQPQEQGSSDHSNEDLANIAGTAGASEDTQRCIVKGAQVESAQQAAQESVKKLQEASPGGVSTPSVLHNGTKIDHSNPNWLPQLLGGAQ